MSGHAMTIFARPRQIPQERRIHAAAWGAGLALPDESGVPMVLPNASRRLSCFLLDALPQRAKHSMYAATFFAIRPCGSPVLPQRAKHSMYAAPSSVVCRENQSAPA
jgi:hypothetical protein